MRICLAEDISRILLEVAEYSSQARIDELGNYLAKHNNAIRDGDNGDELRLVSSVILYMLPETVNPVRYMSLIFLLIKNEDISSWLDAEFVMPGLLLPPNRVITRATKLIDMIHNSLKIFDWKVSNKGENKSKVEKITSNGVDNALLSSWIITRARRIESQTGVIKLITDIFKLQEYIPRAANEWYLGVCVPVQTYITKFNLTVSLERFEARTPLENVQLLLSHTSSKTITADITQLIKAYLNYCKSWSSFWHWVVERASHDFSIIHELVIAPKELQSFDQVEFTKACLAAIYQSKNIDSKTLNLMNTVISSLNRDLFFHKAEPNTQATIPDSENSLDTFALESLDLLSIENCPLYELTIANYELLNCLVRAATILQHNITDITIRKLCEIKFAGEVAEQRYYITRLLYDQDLTRVSSSKLSGIIHDISWLINDSKIFSHVSFQDIAKDILEAALLAGQFEFVQSLFIPENLIPLQEMENIVLRVFNTFYDKASNGNKTRGHMKSAAATLYTMSQFPTHSAEYLRYQRLLDAAHALCFYSLTLKQGVPFKPIDLKLHADPLEIIQKTLSLNAGSYKRPEEFIRIAEDIIYGTNNETTILLNSTTVSTEIRVKAICIQEALINNDFDVAYEYCMEYLVGNNQEWKRSTHYQEIAWTTCFLIGKYCSADWDVCPINIAQKQMKILSVALKICPKESFDQVLKAWRQKELEMNDHKTPEYSNSSSFVQFPVSLHDVLSRRSQTEIDNASKSLSPLHNALGSDAHATSHHSASRIARALASSASAFSEANEDSLNLGAKKDQISNLLVNGIGWAIGASKH
ncbi:secretory pathway Sec39 [Nadsonia fulvescens var. elongata DSM 6958]|uniref:Secretory pathway Sec39 n=1 Tax=Nadsonia fulvescens var. elongata DSM 6958 TaxID=857566 RepID=A0A1E3PE59_9ASCO|nr:secretory pathway Sec39 [Nadsonia fulvescens var. elongata DSM 6958]